MDIAAWQHRATETTINEKTGRFNKKKRFGKSLAHRAPAMLIQILNNKLLALGKTPIQKVDRYAYRASQYDFTNGQYRKKDLPERWFIIGNGDAVQRDLYSSWLLMNADKTLMAPDLQRCRESYDIFKIQHDREIERVKKATQKLSSFGI